MYRTLDPAKESQKPDIDINDNIVNTAKNNLMQDGYLTPVFIMIKNDEFICYPIPPSRMDNKDDLVKSLQQEIDKHQPNVYYFINEVYFYSPKNVNKQNVDEFVKEFIGDNVEILVPKEDKSEGICINVVRVEPDKTKNRWFSIIEFHRDADGKVTHFSPENWVKDKTNGVNLQGRFII